MVGVKERNKTNREMDTKKSSWRKALISTKSPIIIFRTIDILYCI